MVLEKVERGDAKFPPSLPVVLFACRRAERRGGESGGVTVEGNSFPESSYVPPSSKKESPESNKGSGDCVARSAQLGSGRDLYRMRRRKERRGEENRGEN